MTLPAPHLADHDPEAVYLATLGPGSRRAAISGLAALRTILQQPLDTAVPGALTRMRDTLRAGGGSPAYCNKLLAYAAGVLRAAYRIGHLDDHALALRLAAIPRFRGTRTKPGRALTVTEIATLYHTVPPEDQAMLALLLDAGLRTHECRGLTWDRCTLTDHPAVLVRGKGDRERWVPLNRRVAHALRWWHAHREPPDAPPCRLTERGLRSAVQRWCIAAGIQPVSPHSLRRTFISRLLPRVDIATVQRLVGHSDPRTTASYDRRPIEILRAAVDALDADGPTLDIGETVVESPHESADHG